MEGADPVPFPAAGMGDCSETTVEIKIKTLDSQTYTLRVDKFVPVPALKEQIANVTGVVSEQQRLICRGKVLKDDELLSAYHVEDGHTLHLVVRQPIDSSSSTSGLIGTDSRPNLTETIPPNRGTTGHNLIFGAVNLSGQGYASTPDLSRIFSTVITSLGGNNTDNGGVEIGSREHGSGNNGGTENSISVNPTQIQVDQRSAGVEFDQYQGTSQFPPSAHITVIPDSLTTLSHYINHMQRQFDSVGSSGGNSQAAATGDQENSTSQGLPTPAALANVVLSARRLLVEPVAGSLSELASQLQNQSSISDSQTRSQIQSYSLRSGVLLQNVGSLLLELGRTIMTVRMGQTPDDAVVNAGPAIFISGSSPNPIMVQAAIGLGGSGSPHPANVLAGGLGSGLLSRNIDIRIRRGNSMVPSSPATNGSEPSNGQQSSGRSDSSRRYVDNLFHRILQGVSSAPPGSGESTVRVVPIRTVIAIPAGVSRPPVDSSANPGASLYPLFTRFQDQVLHGQNDARGSAASTEILPVISHDQTTVSGYDLQGPNTESTNVDTERNGILFPTNSSPGVHFSSSPVEPAQHLPGYLHSPSISTERQDGGDAALSQTLEPQGGEMTMSEFLDRMGISTAEIEATIDSWVSPSNANEDSMNPPRQETVEEGNQDGIFFSSLLQQIMPYISQGNALQDSNTTQNLPGEHGRTSNEEDEGQHSMSAQNRRDPPDDPASKRQKTE